MTSFYFIVTVQWYAYNYNCGTIKHHYLEYVSIMHLLVSTVFLEGMKDATKRAQTTKNAPKTNGGPGTS